MHMVVWPTYCRGLNDKHRVLGVLGLGAWGFRVFGFRVLGF